MSHEHYSSRRALDFPEMPWSDVSTPGCYLVTQTGRLLRVTPDSLRATIKPDGVTARSWVARISNNPEEPLAVLRDLASAGGYFVTF